MSHLCIYVYCKASGSGVYRGNYGIFAIFSSFFVSHRLCTPQPQKAEIGPKTLLLTCESRLPPKCADRIGQDMRHLSVLWLPRHLNDAEFLLWSILKWGKSSKRSISVHDLPWHTKLPLVCLPLVWKRSEKCEIRQFCFGT